MENMNLYHWLHSHLASGIRRYSQLEIKGIEHLPPIGQGSVLACNHSGNFWWDAICLMAGISDRQVHFIAHHWDASIAPIKWFLEQLDNYFLDLSLEDIQKNNPVVEALASGNLMCQYPEESYHMFKDRYTLFRFSPQILKYAHLAQVPICPVAVIGIEEAVPTFFGLKFTGVPLPIPLHMVLILPLKVTIEIGTSYTVEELCGISRSGKINTTAYQTGADTLREKLAELIRKDRPCRISDIRYAQESRLF